MITTHRPAARLRQTAGTLGAVAREQGEGSGFYSDPRVRGGEGGVALRFQRSVIGAPAAGAVVATEDVELTRLRIAAAEARLAHTEAQP